LNLADKTALVTGASRGIGRAIAQRLAADGALVAVHYGSNEAAATETVEKIQANGGRAFAVRAELGVDGDVDTLFAGLEEGLSGQRLDILVNNAGTGAGSIEQTTREEFDRVFAVNVRAPFFIIQRALPLLRDGGRIINIGSADTRIAVTTELAYAMTKGAVTVLSQTLANALGERGITVNTVAPGVTDTERNAWLNDKPELLAATASAAALGRIGQPADIADVVAFLASDDARWITGHLVDATGGMMLGPRMYLILSLQVTGRRGRADGRVARLLFGRSRSRCGSHRAGVRRRLHQLGKDHVPHKLRLDRPHSGSLGLVDGRAPSDLPTVGAEQGIALAGVEVLAVGVADWAAIVAIQLLQLRNWKSLEPHLRLVGVAWIVMGQVATLPFVAAGGAMLGWGMGGLYWLVAGVVLSFLVAVADAWVILVEIHR